MILHGLSTDILETFFFFQSKEIRNGDLILNSILRKITFFWILLDLRLVTTLVLFHKSLSGINDYKPGALKLRLVLLFDFNSSINFKNDSFDGSELISTILTRYLFNCGICDRNFEISLYVFIVPIALWYNSVIRLIIFAFNKSPVFRSRTKSFGRNSTLKTVYFFLLNKEKCVKS
ncbi:hypothetical protein BpHYR1_046398 [Brachionus plicatilis]|uniref:Uncharacterized protein n=1 Tax=Brachionus plicatilis TaxID=10195 RepID=A0A3M7RHB8_BRAPC|nr:hypothetical protein BpHYR1_046398 [Brachionus plicatilis]